MASARGDSKPCTHTECSGTMQFGRQQMVHVPPVEGERGWVCSANAGHFTLDSERSRAQTVAGRATQGRWEDDGGSTNGKSPIESGASPAAPGA